LVTFSRQARASRVLRAAATWGGEGGVRVRSRKVATGEEGCRLFT
jgi:hypothetical protein